MAQTNPAERIVVVPGSAGVAVIIRCTLATTVMEIAEETGPNGVQGLQGNYLDPFTGQPSSGAPVETWTEADGPIIIGDPHNTSRNAEPIGNAGSGGWTDTRSTVPQVIPSGPGAQTPALGTPVIALRSLSATGTTVRVKEWAR